jgi:hypothetical protein
MKMITVVSLLLCPLFSSAAVTLLQAPGSSPGDYQKTLVSQNYYVSYIQNRVDLYQSNHTQEDKIYSFADEVPFSTSRFLQNIKELRAEAPLSVTSWNFLADFLPRIEISTVLPAQRAAFTDLLCQAQLFTGKDVFNKCSHETVSLKELRSVFPQVEALYAEGRTFSLEDQLPLPKTSQLHWVLLSNSYKEIHFWGSFEDLRRNHFQFEELISGSCEGFQVKDASFELLATSAVFFSNSCVKKAFEPPPQESWVSRNKHWLIPVSAVLVGASAYSMKDNPIIIEAPSFK